MDKKRMNDDKNKEIRENSADLSGTRLTNLSGKVEIDEGKGVHRLVARIPEFSREYGIWIITGTLNNRTPVDSFDARIDRKFDFYSLSHMYEGKGKLKLFGSTQLIHPGDMVLICPGDEHRYGGCGGESYCEDAICFCGAMADAMRKKRILNSGVVRGGSVRRLKQLAELSKDPSLAANLQACIMLQQLLYDLFVAAGRESDPMELLISAIRNAPSDHWWRVSELAELRGVSEDTLRREFVRYTGVLPKNYIESFKLRQAAEMLLKETVPVIDVAVKFGYMDGYHFSRRFKHFFGISPDNYRKVLSNSGK